ncbi:S-adenosyl-L-methionine-dependent methyltransferase [Canariomyces notabilis]|uniref:S-adenosyl-L-methionine-dependent methyltransferase n=1 Tax=Canariomyces notabilis TaxID=2074819 RepID=A0AAN6TC51_9PEZI|nr:S-adenosyl-L-methionine-dependent methyltransferase [Canariomyces arenarius]
MADAEKAESSPSPAIAAGAAAGGPSSPPPVSPNAPGNDEFIAPTEGTIIEAADSDESDDGYATDDMSRGSTSISSSVRDYAFENNRRYHKFKEGAYAFPNDEPEQEREDMKHAMIVNLCDGRLHYAPLKNPQKILDVGTGTGIWAIDMADEYPEAEVTGIDLSPIQPNWTPPNVSFLVDDAESEWLYKPGTFDYIHIRHMTSSIRDWPKLLAQAYTALKPGGWIELQELRFIVMCDDGTLKDDDPVADFINNVKKGLAALGVDLLSMEKHPQRLEEAGFTNIDKTVLKVPIGVWPRDPKLRTIGLYNRSMIYDGLQGIAMGPYTRGLKWTPAEVEVYLIGVRKGLMNHHVHSYYPFHAVIGQKPL